MKLSTVFLAAFFTLASAAPVPSALDLATRQQQVSGFATWYDARGITTSCGTIPASSDFYAAISVAKFGKGADCNRNIKVTAGSKSVTVKLLDEGAVLGTNDIDLSSAAFSQLANKDVGRISVTWSFV